MLASFDDHNPQVKIRRLNWSDGMLLSSQSSPFQNKPESRKLHSWLSGNTCIEGIAEQSFHFFTVSSNVKSRGCFGRAKMTSRTDTLRLRNNNRTSAATSKFAPSLRKRSSCCLYQRSKKGRFRDRRRIP